MNMNLNEKVDFNTLSYFFTGGAENFKEITYILNDEVDKGLSFSNNFTYENLFFRMCPDLNFKLVEKYTSEYVKKIDSMLRKIEVLNVSNFNS